MVKKDLTRYGGGPSGITGECYSCGSNKNIRVVGVTNGEGEFFSCGIDDSICARCASKTTVYELVLHLDVEAGKDPIPDYPGDGK